jgi:ABC-2 type transport system permease protein
VSTLTGASALLRQNLRRDRIIAPVWIAVMVVFAIASAAATPSLFKTEADQLRLASSLDQQPALRALYGPILDPHAVGELAMSKMTVLYALFAAVLFVILVRRHTRVEEESGRAELIGSTVVGRDAPAAAAVGECLGLAVVLGVLVAVADIAGGLDVAGSCWFGMTWIGTGWVATGASVLACQLSASARTCAAVAAGLIGGAYVVRALGDGFRATWLSWLSPFGWNTQLRAWSDPRGWVVLLYVALTAALLVVARVLRGHRDLGGGLLAARPGRPTGARWLASPLGLSMRVHRTMLLLWTVAVGGLGVAFGAMAPGLDDLIQSVGGGQDLIDRLGGAMIAAVLSGVAMVITCYGITVITHAASDETGDRAELVLATGASRAGWFGATALTALGGSLWLLLVTGVGLWIGYGAAGGPDPSTSVPAAVAWMPAVLCVVTLALLAWSLRPGWAVSGWAVLAVFLLLTLVGELLRLPGWLVRLSPYSAVPQYPVQAWRWTPELVLLAVTALVGGCAWLRFRGRDIG